MKEKKMTVLVTGAASGIGLAAARALIERGHTVFGLDIAPIPKDSGIRPLRADVRNEEEILAAVDALELEGVELDAILAAAGVHTIDSFLEARAADLRRVLEINLVGTILVCRFFHRLLRDGGRIILVTSELATYDPLPFNGLYTVSKNALESYAQALRQEMNLIGQRVITVRPGAVATRITEGTAIAASEFANSTSLFLRGAHRFAGLTERLQGKPIPPERLARLLVRTVEAAHPRLSYTCHRHAGLLLLSALPKRLQCAIVRLLLHRN